MTAARNALLEAAWHALDETMPAPLDHTPESLLALESSDTGDWKPVVYFGTVLRRSHDHLPSNCQHSLITRLESTLADVTKDVRAVPRHTVTSASDTPTTAAPGALGGARSSGGGLGVPSGAP